MRTIIWSLRRTKQLDRTKAIQSPHERRELIELFCYTKHFLVLKFYHSLHWGRSACLSTTSSSKSSSFLGWIPDSLSWRSNFSTQLWRAVFFFFFSHCHLQVWDSYFYLSVIFINQPCLQLESFSPSKRKKTLEKWALFFLRASTSCKEQAVLPFCCCLSNFQTVTHTRILEATYSIMST